MVEPEPPAGWPGPLDAGRADLADPAGAEAAVADRPDVIVHLAAVVSGEAEADFDKGYRVNLDGTRNLLEAIRAGTPPTATGRGWCSPPPWPSTVRRCPHRSRTTSTSRR